MLVQGVALIAVAVVVAVGVYVYRHDRSTTARIARQACERTMLIAPYLLADYERRGVLPPKVLAEYRAAIPTACGPGSGTRGIRR
jgi:hypothetical protein